MKSIEESIPSCTVKLQTEQNDNGILTVTSVFSFPPSFAGFGGHFPGNPVLPGIVQLSTIRYAAEQAVQKRLRPVNINRTKFRAMIKPDQQVHIRLDFKAVGGQYHGRFQIRDSNKEMIASGQYIFSELDC
jgi:3-hydroxymyristoyl/3-hydroxydecanoyl-(acyl carrier protein) dehydratase